MRWCSCVPSARNRREVESTVVVPKVVKLPFSGSDICHDSPQPLAPGQRSSAEDAASDGPKVDPRRTGEMLWHRLRLLSGVPGDGSGLQLASRSTNEASLIPSFHQDAGWLSPTARKRASLPLPGQVSLDAAEMAERDSALSATVRLRGAQPQACSEPPYSFLARLRSTMISNELPMGSASTNTNSLHMANSLGNDGMHAALAPGDDDRRLLSAGGLALAETPPLPPRAPLPSEADSGSKCSGTGADSAGAQ